MDSSAVYKLHIAPVCILCATNNAKPMYSYKYIAKSPCNQVMFVGNNLLVYLHHEPIYNNVSHCSFADTPYHWDEMSDEREYDLYVVLEESPEYWQVASLFRNTLPSSRIVRIERIQNKVLWENYQQRKKRLEKVVHARDIEKLLFHGTSTTEPEKIYAGEVGFDMRMSAHGMWGEGCYFAVNASYSIGYAHRLSSGMSQLLVARVLTGGATHDDRQRGKVLPTRTSSDRVKGQIERQYTCVRAFTGGSEIYVTKENSYAYPEYLITFQ